MNTENRGKKNRNSQQNCGCSRCGACIDNARWDRIFREKFEDPFYYNQKHVRNASPIVDL